MWGVLSSLFSGNTDKIVDGVYNGVDMAFFTDEEKSKANQTLLDWKLKWLESTKPQNVSRRFIAIVVTLLWALIVVVMLVAQGAGFTEYAKFTYDVMKDIVAIPFSIILGFYFLAHITRNIGDKQ